MSVSAEQVPGIYRRKVGEVLVTVLNDGAIVLPPAVLLGISAEAQEALMHAAGRRPPFETSINTFLLQWPGRTVLIDTGAGMLFGPTAGKLAGNLRAAGVAPGDITDIALTHLHGDHVGGLLDGAGVPVFPNATLWVAEAERAFWSDDAMKQAALEARRGSFDLAQRSLQAYEGHVKTFAAGEIMPGLDAVALPGHTPGHTGFLLTDGGETLLIWGDVFHNPVVQAAHPDIGTGFDTDPGQAMQSRRGILDRAVTEDLLVNGMHMAFPGLARIARSGDGYVVQPEVWRAAL